MTEILPRFGVEPTMCVMDKGLEANQRFSAILYVIENRTRSSLAPRMNGFRTHDVYEAKRISSRWRFLESSRTSGTCSLYVASC